MTTLLEVRDLSVEYRRGKTTVPAVRDVSLSIEEGETLALVGESGCGKSTLALSLMGLIYPEEGSVTNGSVRYRGEDLYKFSPVKSARHWIPRRSRGKNAPAFVAGGREIEGSLRLLPKEHHWQSLRGKEIAMVFQDPFAALNPVIRIEEQLTEGVLAHFPETPRSLLKEKARIALSEVLFTDTDRILASYPHQLSGGQRQRVVMAMAIINRPRLLIADEPTTALDVTIQKEILDLLDRIKKELSLTVLLITHNLPLACTRASRVAVMYAGQIVEYDRTENIFKHPRHPYTRGLIASVPQLFHPLATQPLRGQPPDMSSLPYGCAFAPRCPESTEQCKQEVPGVTTTNDAFIRCWRRINKLPSR